MKKDYWLYLLAMAGGAVIWALVAAAAGKEEAWDSDMYFSIGIPVTCLISLVFGFVQPIRPWRWGIAPFAGQLIWILLTQGFGNLLPLGMILFGVLSVPSIITANIGAFIANKIKKS